MMKDEILIAKSSVKVFLVISVVMLVLSFVWKDVSIIFGFILGYIINLINYRINVASIDYLMDIQIKNPRTLGSAGFFIRFSIYALGFFLAVKIPKIFCLYTVAIGYLCIRLSIYYMEFNKRKGE